MVSDWEQGIKGVAAVLQEPDISTDIILPGQFMVTVSRKGLGKGLFFNWRYDSEGEILPDFVLNQSPFDEASFLIVGENFGCGSSREHAVWALLDFGIRAVIAPSFSQTFATNAAKNGLAAIQLDEIRIVEVVHASQMGPERSMELLLEDRMLKIGSMCWRFELTAEQISGLIDGVDDLELAEMLAAQTGAFWRGRRRANSWLDNHVPADEK